MRPGPSPPGAGSLTASPGSCRRGSKAARWATVPPRSGRVVLIGTGRRLQSGPRGTRCDVSDQAQAQHPFNHLPTILHHLLNGAPDRSQDHGAARTVATRCGPPAASPGSCRSESRPARWPTVPRPGRVVRIGARRSLQGGPLGTRCDAGDQGDQRDQAQAHPSRKHRSTLLHHPVNVAPDRRQGHSAARSMATRCGPPGRIAGQLPE